MTDKHNDRWIDLSKGHTARVSARDWPWISQHSWGYNGDNSPYACRTASHRGKRTKVYLHREVCKAPRGMVANHIDGDTLNCARWNLNVCTVRENGTVFKVKKSKLGLIGVDLRGGVKKPVSTRKDYRARITDGKVYRFIGHFRNIDDAARAYDRESVKMFGLYAPTNFPIEDYNCPFIPAVQRLVGTPESDIPW